MSHYVQMRTHDGRSKIRRLFTSWCFQFCPILLILLNLCRWIQSIIVWKTHFSLSQSKHKNFCFFKWHLNKYRSISLTVFSCMQTLFLSFWDNQTHYLSKLALHFLSGSCIGTSGHQPKCNTIIMQSHRRQCSSVFCILQTTTFRHKNAKQLLRTAIVSFHLCSAFWSLQLSFKMQYDYIAEPSTSVFISVQKMWSYFRL